MPRDNDDLNECLKKTIEQQAQMIDTLNETIKGLEATIANLNETIDELKRKLFGTSSETIKRTTSTDDEAVTVGEEKSSKVKEHTRVQILS